MWMLVEGILLYRKTTKLGSKPPKLAAICAFAWGMYELVSRCELFKLQLAYVSVVFTVLMNTKFTCILSNVTTL